MTLLHAESGFRMLKGKLGLRPNFHQLEHRVDAHIFISVLANHLLSWVRHHMDRGGGPREWKTLRWLLGPYSLVSTRLPREDGRIITVRKPSRPDAEQAWVYKILGIDWKRACPAMKSALKATAILECLCDPAPGFIGAARQWKETWDRGVRLGLGAGE